MKILHKKEYGLHAGVQSKYMSQYITAYRKSII